MPRFPPLPPDGVTFEKMSCPGDLEKLPDQDLGGNFRICEYILPHATPPLMTSHSEIPWCSKYEGNMKEYVEYMKEEVENMKEYIENM